MLKPYWFQEEAIDNAFAYIRQTGLNPLIQAPTGSGKSVIVANIISRFLKNNPKGKVVQLAHQKELIEQNSECFEEWFPKLFYGICAAELGRRNTNDQVIFGQIQTIKNYVKKLGHVDLIVVDEAHWGVAQHVSMYNNFFNYLREINPNLIIIGLTATPFTKKGSSLLNTGIFHNLVYNIPITTLIKEKFLCEPIPISCLNQADLSHVKTSNGDFNLTDMAAAFHENDVTNKALKEVTKFGNKRKKWLVFASNVAHTKEVCAKLNDLGIKSNYIVGDTGKDRARILEDFKNGEYQALVNYGVLTTGVNVRDIDMIVMLRGTQSPGLWIQILGRGMRTHPNKDNCLVLDFGGNIERFGAIDKMTFKRGAKTERTALTITPVKICRNTNCRASNAANAKKCKYCGTEFMVEERALNIDTVSGSGQILSTQELKPIVIPIDDVSYKKHVKRANGNQSMRVMYRNGITIYNEWLAFGNNSANFKTHPWWRARCDLPIPVDVDEALKHKDCLLKPKAIKVRTGGKHPEVIGYEF